MKKTALTFTIALLAFASQAQDIGVRFGNTIGSDVAIDAVFNVGRSNRVHADLSFGKNGISGVGVEALWDFVYKPLGDVERLYWYAGAGPWLFIGDPFLIGIAGEVGMEYRFTDIPLALGIDWRPSFRLNEGSDLRGDGFGFNVRYIIGQ